MNKKVVLVSLILVVGIIFYLYRGMKINQELKEQPAESQKSSVDHSEGKVLAIQYCSGCHTFPEPELLDSTTWINQTLPAMGPILGIREFDGEEYPMDESPGLPENFYPDEPLIDQSTWQQIIDFYLRDSPARLQHYATETDIIEDDHVFKPVSPSYRPNSNPMVSAVRFDSANGLIYAADANVEKLLVFNRNMDIEAAYDVPSPISDIQFLGDVDKSGKRELLLTQIGSISPSDLKNGAIFKGWIDPETGEGQFNTLVMDQLRRPVETLSADLDGDGLDDLLVSEFGHRTGSIFWLKNDGDGYESKKRTLLETPGCLQSHVLDFTDNGHPDILSLCSQVDQKILLFENQGNGEFSTETILQFPVTAGSSSFELVDFNGNGHLDILYTSGDNADYSMVYKPYHGVYVYENDGSDRFTEKWFYSVNGAYQTHTADFNQNGRMDIAVISFFADYARKPQEGFIFFENNGGYDFTPYHPRASSYGRWITMDAADWTGNGKTDIVLANFSMGPTKVLPQIETILTQSPHLLLLENTGID